MEKIMSKSNATALDEKRDEVTTDELDAVTGGCWPCGNMYWVSGTYYETPSPTPTLAHESMHAG
jgi:hypothetical protein